VAPTVLDTPERPRTPGAHRCPAPAVAGRPSPPPTDIGRSASRRTTDTACGARPRTSQSRHVPSRPVTAQ